MSSATYSYDHNGNPTSITRIGITEKNGTSLTYGTIDQMSFSYIGNQLKKIDDNGADLSYEGAMDFSDGSTATTEYTWDKNGNMTINLHYIFYFRCKSSEIEKVCLILHCGNPTAE